MVGQATGISAFPVGDILSLYLSLGWALPQANWATNSLWATAWRQTLRMGGQAFLCSISYVLGDDVTLTSLYLWKRDGILPVERK